MTLYKVKHLLEQPRRNSLFPPLTLSILVGKTPLAAYSRLPAIMSLAWRKAP